MEVTAMREAISDDISPNQNTGIVVSDLITRVVNQWDTTILIHDLARDRAEACSGLSYVTSMSSLEDRTAYVPAGPRLSHG